MKVKIIENNSYNHIIKNVDKLINMIWDDPDNFIKSNKSNNKSN